MQALEGIELAGADVVELGCGTAYWSAWLARRGASPVGIDITDAQLETARRLQAEHGLTFPLINASAEDVPLPDASFDLAFSEYGASIWCDPYRGSPRRRACCVRAGGSSSSSTARSSCSASPDDENEPADADASARLLRHAPLRVAGRAAGIEFHLGYGDWIRVLRANGFEVENLIEVRPAEDATTTYPFVTLEWARRWPSEEIWVARKK